MFFPDYRPDQRFPDLEKFRKEFTKEILTLIDAQWWNHIHGLHVEFRHNLVATARFMRMQWIAISQINPVLPKNIIDPPRAQDKTYASAIAPATPFKENKEKDLVYEKKRFFINIFTPMRKEREVENEETVGDLDSDISKTLKQTSDILFHREIPEDASFIKGFCDEVPQINI